MTGITIGGRRFCRRKGWATAGRNRAPWCCATLTPSCGVCVFTPTRAAADYLSPLPPGHQQSATEPEATRHDDATRNHHLAILNFKVTAIDWLALRKEGHCRARLTPDGVVEWLVP
jgi:hypothetical protein